MRHFTRSLAPTLAMIALAGGATALAACGTDAAPATSTAKPAVFPLTITRTGGIAGFSDVLVVTADGRVSVRRKGKDVGTCRLTSEVATKVVVAASQVPWPGSTASTANPSIADDLVTMVMSPAGGPLRLADPEVGQAGEVFNDLLNDLSRDVAATSSLCTPT